MFIFLFVYSCRLHPFQALLEHYHLIIVFRISSEQMLLVCVRVWEFVFCIFLTFLPCRFYHHHPNKIMRLPLVRCELYKVLSFLLSMCICVCVCLCKDVPVYCLIERELWCLFNVSTLMTSWVLWLRFFVCFFFFLTKTKIIKWNPCVYYLQIEKQKNSIYFFNFLFYMFGLVNKIVCITLLNIKELRNKLCILKIIIEFKFLLELSILTRISLIKIILSI